MISVLQLHARDVPGLPFPQGTDCFQLLWCPNEHRPGRYPTIGALHVAAFWRRAAAVTEVLGSPPAPRFDRDMNARRYQPLPCLLNPEPVTEYPSCSHYPDYSDLPEPLRPRVERWDDLTAGLYTEVLSTAPGTKAGGHPKWIQEADWPVCGCGRRMDHLLTIASAEWGDRMRWIPPKTGTRPSPANTTKRHSAAGCQSSPATFPMASTWAMLAPCTFHLHHLPAPPTGRLRADELTSAQLVAGNTKSR
jgi:hypothetical protein